MGTDVSKGTVHDQKVQFAMQKDCFTEAKIGYIWIEMETFPIKWVRLAQNREPKAPKCRRTIINGLERRIYRYKVVRTCR